MKLHDLVRQLARRPGGVGVYDLRPDFTVRQVHNAVYSLEKKSELHKAKAQGYHTRWFTTAHARDTYLKGPSEHKRAKRSWNSTGARDAADKAFRRAHGARADWAHDAPAHVPAHVVVQQCQSAPPRFREHTFCFVHNGLAAA